jgi:hypothetical protein
MSVGSVVDHAVALYRHSWRPFALLAVVWWIPSLVSSVVDFGGPVNRALTESAGWLEKQAVVALICVPLLLLSVIALAGIGPLAGLAVWAASPRHRSRRLKWLIVLSAPFGLFVYLYMRWSLWGPLVLLESKGPMASLLVAPILPIALTLLTVHLRNEREGADLHARLSALESLDTGFKPARSGG